MFSRSHTHRQMFWSSIIYIFCFYTEQVADNNKQQIPEPFKLIPETLDNPSAPGLKKSVAKNAIQSSCFTSTAVNTGDFLQHSQASIILQNQRWNFQ